MNSPSEPIVRTDVAASILVVDDSEKNARLLSDLLQAKGYRASTAASGPQALEHIESAPPDLVLLDVMMPGMSGYEVCKRLRADPRHAHLPILLVTALDPATERAKGLDAGADDFLSKPIHQVELLARVRSLLRVKALQDDLLRERSRTAAPPSSAFLAEVVALYVTWPGLAREATEREPATVLARMHCLRTAVAQHSEQQGAAVAGRDAMGLMAIFGGPDTVRDRCERALRLAGALLSTDDGLSIGVAAGPAALGHLPGVVSEYAALGPVVLQAARLGQAAGPGEAVVSAELAAALGDGLEFVALVPGNDGGPLAACRIVPSGLRDPLP